MTVFQWSVGLALVVPVLAIVRMAMVEARREPDRERPMMTDGTWGAGGTGGSDGGG